MAKRLHVGVDLDGVVYDFIGAFRRYLVGCGFAASQLPDPQQWEAWESWPMGRDEWLAHFSAGVESGEIFGRGAPYPGAVAALNALELDGHFIHIVTHRNVHSRAIGLTAQWLAEHGIPYSSLTFAADKTVVPCDIFVEDNVDNARAVADAGAVAVLMDRPWNRGAPDGIGRVSTWDEFARMVGELQ